MRAYDADDPEAWLEETPGVHLRFSRQIGKGLPGARDLETFWED